MSDGKTRVGALLLGVEHGRMWTITHPNIDWDSVKHGLREVCSKYRERELVPPDHWMSYRDGFTAGAKDKHEALRQAQVRSVPEEESNE